MLSTAHQHTLSFPHSTHYMLIKTQRMRGTSYTKRSNTNPLSIFLFLAKQTLTVLWAYKAHSTLPYSLYKTSHALILQRRSQITKTRSETSFFSQNLSHESLSFSPFQASISPSILLQWSIKNKGVEFSCLNQRHEWIYFPFLKVFSDPEISKCSVLFLNLSS